MKPYSIFLNDCIRQMDNIDDESIDLIVCDLPYGITACDWDICIPFDDLWNQYERIIKKNAAIVLFGSQPFTTKLINSNLKLFKYELIWEKSKASNFIHSKYQFLKAHENIIIFSRGGITNGSKIPMKYNPQKSEGKTYTRILTKRQPAIYNRLEKNESISITNSGRFPRSILYYPNASDTDGAFHPTQKPVKLLEYLIKTFTNENDTVLDNCMGSGSTGIACLNTNRHFIGIEKNEKYFEIAKHRLENHIIKYDKKLLDFMK